ncbi:MAG: chemotaxis protein CheW [Caulobacter sp.]|nr:chemotaxis protein CheW [Caulobacter sp.]
MDSLARRGPGHGEYVAFRVAGQSFCVDIMTVREIRGWSAETRVPQAPAYMRGVTNLRGAILPIIDAATRLDLPSAGPSARSVTIVLQHGDRLAGLLVDEVSDIVTVAPEDIQPTPDLACTAEDGFVCGLISMNGDLMSKVSVERLLFGGPGPTDLAAPVAA